MSKYWIRGIQQVGVGVGDLEVAWKWYRKYFGADICVFDDNHPAEFMLPYTGGEPRPKRAVMAINMQGGGGFEIWQHQGFEPRYASFEFKLGDLGIFSCKIKTRNVEKAYSFYKEEGVYVTPPVKDPAGNLTFWLKDPWNNWFHIVPNESWFKKTKAPSGLACGVVIGTSDIDKSLKVYQDILGYDVVDYDVSGKFADLAGVNGGQGEFRRVRLSHSEERRGGFGKLFGETEIELIQSLDRKGRDMFEDRYWGEPGFIHVCFDIFGMNALRQKCKEVGKPFTVDSQAAQEGTSFDMGDSSGLFSYIDDDKTLIEFVEGHRLPLVKSIGWELDLKNRPPEKPIPGWIMSALKTKRIKD